MSLSKTKIITTVACALVLSVIALAGCSSTPPSVATSPDTPVPEQVEESENTDIAATAGECSITEQQVEDYISQYRTYIEAEDDIDFATLLDEAGQTPEDIRQDAIHKLMETELLYKEAEKQGVSAADDEIDAYIASAKDGLGYSSDDEGWTSILDISGYDAEQYRRDVETKLLLDKLVGAQNNNFEATEGQMLALADKSPEDYLGYNIVEVVYPANAGSTASTFADKMVNANGARQFREAAAEQVDKGLAEEVVDAGWTSTNEKISYAVLNALVDAEVGDTVFCQDDDGTYKVVYVEEGYLPAANGRLSLGDMPEPIKAKLKSDASALNRQVAVQDYLDNLYDQAEVSINEMPQNAPYNVDMTLSIYGDENTLTDEEMESISQEHVSNMEKAEQEQ